MQFRVRPFNFIRLFITNQRFRKRQDNSETASPITESLPTVVLPYYYSPGTYVANPKIIYLLLKAYGIYQKRQFTSCSVRLFPCI